MNMKILNYLEQHLKMLATLVVTGAMIFLAAGCGVDGGKVENEVQLPTDSTLNFHCEEEGIYKEDCVLDNSENPYANVAITADPDDPDNPNDKFVLNDAAPSAKARYYLWATALAKGAGIPGENQYYTALSLQEVFAESGSPTTRDQAVKAYRSVLDNYFLQPTFFVIIVDGEEVAFAASLKDLTGENLYDPVIPTLVSLYTDPIFALEDMSEWGYIYDVTNKTTTEFK
jgi:hypothetical protein